MSADSASGRAADLSESAPVVSSGSAIPEHVLPSQLIRAAIEDAEGAEGTTQSGPHGREEVQLLDPGRRAKAALRPGNAAAARPNAPRRAGFKEDVARADADVKADALWHAELRGALRDAEARTAENFAQDERTLTQKALTLLPASADSSEVE